MSTRGRGKVEGEFVEFPQGSPTKHPQIQGFFIGFVENLSFSSASGGGPRLATKLKISIEAGSGTTLILAKQTLGTALSVMNRRRLDESFAQPIGAPGGMQ